MTAQQAVKDKTGEVTITRLFDAPREAVWSAWTQPKEFAQWFGVLPYRTPPDRVKMDVRPGGKWEATQVSEEDGSEIPFFGHYVEVEKPERLVLTFDDESGDEAKAEVVTVTLRATDRGAEMTMRQEGHLPPEQYGEPLQQGYNSFFDRLEEYLALG